MTDPQQTALSHTAPSSLTLAATVSSSDAAARPAASLPGLPTARRCARAVPRLHPDQYLALLSVGRCRWLSVVSHNPVASFPWGRHSKPHSRNSFSRVARWFYHHVFMRTPPLTAPSLPSFPHLTPQILVVVAHYRYYRVTLTTRVTGLLSLSWSHSELTATTFLIIGVQCFLPPQSRWARLHAPLPPSPVLPSGHVFY